MSIPLSVVPVVGLPEVTEGDRLGELVAGAAQLEPRDVLVVSQKVVSKAEGRVRRLAEVEPGSQARELASRLDKDPALVQAVLDESRAMIRAQEGVLITETHSGWICANAGIDASNLPEEGIVTLLPVDPDASAQRIRSEIRGATGNAPAVVISDSFGRPWRLGQVDVAIGCAGLSPLEDWRGGRDRSGRELTATLIALADELAAAADLVREKDAGVPAAIVRGLGERVSDDDGPGAASIQRPSQDDLFR
jgi:coenzyme F420-0:L-glutamate ligase / coenzyme F420-1:gamma-L-glutamate ligase